MICKTSHDAVAYLGFFKTIFDLKIYKYSYIDNKDENNTYLDDFLFKFLFLAIISFLYS